MRERVRKRTKVRTAMRTARPRLPGIEMLYVERRLSIDSWKRARTVYIYG